MESHRITDKEFVLISAIKDEIEIALNTYCTVRTTDMDICPDLSGKVVWIVKEQSLYRIVVLIRYVNTSNFEDADVLEQYLESIPHNKLIFFPPYITKNGEELEVVITIKAPKER